MAAAEMTGLLDGMLGTTGPLPLGRGVGGQRRPPGIDASCPDANEIMRRQQLR